MGHRVRCRAGTYPSALAPRAPPEPQYPKEVRAGRKGEHAQEWRALDTDAEPDGRSRSAGPLPRATHAGALTTLTQLVPSPAQVVPLLYVPLVQPRLLDAPTPLHPQASAAGPRSGPNLCAQVVQIGGWGTRLRCTAPWVTPQHSRQVTWGGRAPRSSSRSGAAAAGGWRAARAARPPAAS